MPIPGAEIPVGSREELTLILERDSLKWFKPAKGQFQIYYRWTGDHREYQRDFVAETQEAINVLGPKARNEMDDAEVIAKKEVAVKWCRHATDYSKTSGGKPWTIFKNDHSARGNTGVLSLGQLCHYWPVCVGGLSRLQALQYAGAIQFVLDAHDCTKILIGDPGGACMKNSRIPANTMSWWCLEASPRRIKR